MGYVANLGCILIQLKAATVPIKIGRFIDKMSKAIIYYIFAVFLAWAAVLLYLSVASKPAYLGMVLRLAALAPLFLGQMARVQLMQLPEVEKKRLWGFQLPTVAAVFGLAFFFEATACYLLAQAVGSPIDFLEVIGAPMDKRYFLPVFGSVSFWFSATAVTLIATFVTIPFGLEYRPRHNDGDTGANLQG
ncbi:hypothetical protein [Ruegeria atlantica]|uniref:Integral membrane protein n=1 Tax=Ruegeria atlantica TaxID=81569 RepID=A0ABX1WE70_9RHOB|nr:hypothetical protein [Ruegeria atlantica]NOD31610.1 hypothetical protein [Ruegeria atlantica]